MSRTYVVTGAASRIGQVTRELLERGHQVIGVDLQGANANADLCTPTGRADLVTQVSELSGGSVDGILAIAGLARPVSPTVAVNFYGRSPPLSDCARSCSPPTLRVPSW
jgi:NAD(P)-dependent dehydrogenase (short-subunit alcohol dehydrogenase family)